VSAKIGTSRWTGFINTIMNPEQATGFTPRTPVWKKNKATLWYYPSPNKKYRIPVFLIYSLINQPAVLDLSPKISLIEALTNSGFEVYLIDFGIPGYEDRDYTLDDYITHYIQRGIYQALKHSKSETITLMGFCIGGTLAAIYAAIAKERIQNLILFVSPIEFSDYPQLDKWEKALEEEKIDLSGIIDTIGLMPAPAIEAGVRLLTVPIYFSHYLALLNRAKDKEYRKRWSLRNSWVKSHIPLPGGVIKQILYDLVRDNKLIKGELTIRGEMVDLKNIQSSLLVIGADIDQLVPIKQITPILELVSSEDTYLSIQPGGHTNFSINGELPDYLKDWLPERSVPF
jgi:polyhydroxyalkanoate synthase subunit PhaC